MARFVIMESVCCSAPLRRTSTYPYCRECNKKTYERFATPEARAMTVDMGRPTR